MAEMVRFGVEADFASAMREIERLRQDVDRLGETAQRDATRGLDAFTDALEDATQELDDLGDEAKETTRQLDEYGKEAEDAGNRTNAFSSGLKGATVAAAAVTAAVGAARGARGHRGVANAAEHVWRLADLEISGRYRRPGPGQGWHTARITRVIRAIDGRENRQGSNACVIDR